MLRSFILVAAVIVLVGGLAGNRLARGLQGLFARPPAQAQAPTEIAAMVAPASSSRRVELPSDAAGHYHADVDVDGRQIQMLVDTGASVVALTNEDAGKLGIVPFPSDFNVRLQTANGVTLAARQRLDRVRIGSVEVDDVDAVIMPVGAAKQSLLGMSFLKRLHSFESKGNGLTLEQ